MLYKSAVGGNDGFRDFNNHSSQDVCRSHPPKVSSGEFESEADVIISALMALDDEAEPHDEATHEKWLKEVAVPIALRMEANPDEGYTGEQVLAHLEEDLKATRKKHHAAQSPIF